MSFRNNRRAGDYETLLTEIYYDLSDLINNTTEYYALDFTRKSVLNLIASAKDARFSMKLARIESTIRRFFREF